MTPYYDDGDVTVYHGDAREILPELKDIGAVITDPPYGIGVRYGSGYDDSAERYWPWFHSLLAEFRRLSPVVVLTHRVTALQELHDWDWVCVWSKPPSGGVRVGNSPIVPHWEPIIVWGAHTLGVDTEFVRDVFEYRNVRVPRGEKSGRGRESWANENSEFGHPTPKPLGLFHDLVRGFGQRSDVILDPFAGSGTTLVAARNLGKRAIGIEVEERHCAEIVERCAQGVLPLGDVA